MNSHAVLYDGECSFCTFQMKMLRWMDWGNRFALVPAARARACMRGSHLLALGDSTMQDSVRNYFTDGLGVAGAAMLRGLAALCVLAHAGTRRRSARRPLWRCHCRKRMCRCTPLLWVAEYRGRNPGGRRPAYCTQMEASVAQRSCPRETPCGRGWRALQSLGRRAASPARAHTPVQLLPTERGCAGAM